MALPNYSTGTVSVSDGGTVVIGSGTIWSGLNAVAGDMIAIDGEAAVLITDVTDVTHLSIPAWTGDKSGVDYVIYQVSSLRFDDVQIALDLQKQVQALNTEGFYIFVPSAATDPDPSLGDDGQYAFQAVSGKLWVKEAGVWSFLGIYKGFNFRGAYDSGTAYGVNDVLTSGGSSYIVTAPTTGHAPPNATYYSVLASKGDTGTTGSTGTTGAGYGGTSTTSLAIGTGTKAFTTQAGLAYTNGARVRASSAANTSNWMEGLITYSGTTLTMTSDKTNGSGTHTDWNFNLAGVPGAGDLSSANNLSDLASSSTSLTNLGGTTVGKALFTSADAAAARTAVGVSIAPPTVQRFTSGSGTYTTPAGVKYIRVRLVGGGGGGAGSGAGSPGAGGAGGDSTFGSTIAVGSGGAGGSPSTSFPGAGGSASSSGATITVLATGGRGGGGSDTVAAAGGEGGSSFYGGGGSGGRSGAADPGLAGATNTGGGGGGGSGTSSGRPGGGAGGYCEVIITSPLSTYAYAVGSSGSAGAAGTGGAAGGAGGSGTITVEEFY